MSIYAAAIDILTLFPEMFRPVLGTSIPKRAAEKGLVSVPPDQHPRLRHRRA